MSKAVKVDSRYRVTLTKAACEQVGIKPGDVVTFIIKHGHLTVVPLKSIEELQEILKGMNISGYRDEEDRY